LRAGDHSVLPGLAAAAWWWGSTDVESVIVELLSTLSS
jgi:hypothetical protein